MNYLWRLQILFPVKCNLSAQEICALSLSLYIYIYIYIYICVCVYICVCEMCWNILKQGQEVFDLSQYQTNGVGINQLITCLEGVCGLICSFCACHFVCFCLFCFWSHFVPHTVVFVFGFLFVFCLFLIYIQSC